MTEFESVYHQYFKDVYLYIKSLCGNAHIAEDITSEVFLKAIKSIDQFKGNCDIRVWLCQIAKNSYYSHMRKNGKLVVTDKFPESNGDTDIEQIVSSQDASIRIHKILHDLGEPYKEVFSLRVFGELSFKQIAILFQKNENWACVTYHRARKKIQQQMEDYL